MVFKLIIGATCACLAIVSSSAFASTIYDNGTPNQINARNIGGFIAADDFLFTSATKLTGAQIYFATELTQSDWEANGYASSSRITCMKTAMESQAPYSPSIRHKIPHSLHPQSLL